MNTLSTVIQLSRRLRIERACDRHWQKYHGFKHLYSVLQRGYDEVNR